jgi:hypothetical protein
MLVNVRVYPFPEPKTLVNLESIPNTRAEGAIKLFSFYPLPNLIVLVDFNDIHPSKSEGASKF